jgi:xanthine phosphoribosyltransferase
MTGKTIPVSWAELHRAARSLAREVGPRGAWRGIVAVARGGLVPAAVVARELGLRHIEVLAVASYEDRTRGTVSVLSDTGALAKTCGDGAGWLVIEDIADTGNTLKAVRRILPNAHVAVLYVKPDGRPLTDSFVIEVAQDDWVEFPWDAPERG